MPRSIAAAKSTAAAAVAATRGRRTRSARDPGRAGLGAREADRERDCDRDRDRDRDPDRPAEAGPRAEGSMYVVGLLVSPTCDAAAAADATAGRDGDVASGSGSGRPNQAPSANQSAACWAAGRCSGSLASRPRR
ncbi:hypothetical protein ACQF36_42585 [Streptomyces sp. Marseille-Q5077]|uniref:hypothetical protein n=1 Tax=Streptomyces sp. Marseille-Q5077 TaxID=3418995 RepID=UPI003D04C358